MNADLPQPDACEVCGRHMLPGERTRAYVTPARDSRSVCDLCRGKVERAGWVREERAGQLPAQESAQRPRRRLRLRPRMSLRVERQSGEEDRQPAQAPERRGLERPRRRESPERRIRRAIDRFNDSEHRRTVEGLTRSLGHPRVAAITPAEAPELVRLTVAWDLSWYQWKVEFSGRDADVRSLRSGKEVGELGAADRAWNARASEDGRLQLGKVSNGDREARPSGGPA
ncbi:MAG: hypothetical protein ACRDMA_13640 [Solirubrobacterales bacterium]